MITPTSIGGLDFSLLGVEPSWQSAVGAEFEVVADLTSGLTNREARRPYSATLRARLNYSATLTGATARETVTFLRSYQAGVVGVPFWPGAMRWADRAAQVIGSKLKVAWRHDWSQYAVYDDVEPEWCTAEDQVAPLLIGRLNRREAQWTTPGTCEIAIEFIEASAADYALVPAPLDWAAGPAPSAAWATPPKLFPLECAFERHVQSFKVSVQRETIGFGREPAEYVYPQTNAAGQSIGETLLAVADVGKLLRWFLDHGSGAAFWCPTWADDLLLTAPVVNEVLTVEDVEGVALGDWLAFIRGSVQATGRVLAADAQTVILVASAGAHPQDTLVSRLLLVRLDRPKLAVSWVQPGVARAEFDVAEVPPEYTPAADETLGTTISLLPTRCYLYELSRTLNGVTYTSRYTSYESALSYGGNSYAATKMSHGSIRQGLRLDRDEVTLTMPAAAGPLLQLATLKLEAPLRLVIRAGEVMAGAAENTSVLFTGEIVSATVKGSILQAKAITAGSVFDRKVPRLLFQRGCNHSLFSIGCGLAKANWSFTAMVQNPGAPGYPFEFVLQDLQDRGSLVPAGFFAGGWLEVGVGESWQRRAVLISTAPAAGVLTVTLDRDPDPFPEAGAAVTLYPGCDGAAATCRRFENYLNFGGHPFLPLANPSLVRGGESVSGGKK